MPLDPYTDQFTSSGSLPKDRRKRSPMIGHGFTPQQREYLDGEFRNGIIQDIFTALGQPMPAKTEPEAEIEPEGPAAPSAPKEPDGPAEITVETLPNATPPMLQIINQAPEDKRAELVAVINDGTPAAVRLAKMKGVLKA